MTDEAKRLRGKTCNTLTGLAEADRSGWRSVEHWTDEALEAIDAELENARREAMEAIRAIVAECPIELREWPNTNPPRRYPQNAKSEMELVEWVEKLKDAVK